MAADMTTDPRYWLLLGNDPAGPYTASEVHTRLAAGEVVWDCQACLVGGTEWRPLSHTPGIGPHAPSASVPAISPAVPTAVEPSVPAAIALRKKRPGQPPEWVAVLLVVAVFLGFGWMLYRSVWPDSATRVCEKLAAAKTLAEAKPYITPRMYPAMEQAMKETSDPNDAFELTTEVDGPSPKSKRVGFRGSFFAAEEGQRARMEGYLTLIRPGGFLDGWMGREGWRVDDMVITGIEGVSLPGPMSIIDFYRRQSPRNTPAAKPTPLQEEIPWYEQKKYLGPIGLAVVAIGGAIGRWMKRSA